MEKIKVLIADDHRVVREGLAAILKTKDDINVVGEAQDGHGGGRESQDIDARRDSHGREHAPHGRRRSYPPNQARVPAHRHRRPHHV